ncbi:hypothetical protein CRUP_009342 [Coryphaenoides rupestris]|nr:hypothetical protein CRUP_009342 [Coryphaenoides rupestris]
MAVPAALIPPPLPPPPPPMMISTPATTSPSSSSSTTSSSSSPSLVVVVPPPPAAAAAADRHNLFRSELLGAGGSPAAAAAGGTTPLPPGKPVYSTPSPVENTPQNNECKMVELRGARVASFTVDGCELICLPQAFDLFLKHLVGGLHTVYTKLKRLEITPVVCNVEQVRILRGLGAIQPGVNRCKLISRRDFETLYNDCHQRQVREVAVARPQPDRRDAHRGTGRCVMTRNDNANKTVFKCVKIVVVVVVLCCAVWEWDVETTASKREPGR